MKRRFLMGGSAAALAVRPVGAAPPASGPVLLELFTSQGCSSCPPAEAFLSELAHTRPDILALSFHVTYWNGLGWRDPFSLEAGTDRQRRYAALLPSEVYTPQMVVGGSRDVVGSDRARVLAAVSAASEAGPAGPRLTVTRQEGAVAIGIEAGEGDGDVLLVGYDREHRTAIGRGENAGRTLIQSNVVRSLVRVGLWRGPELHLAAPPPQGEHLAVLLQSSKGPILATA